MLNTILIEFPYKDISIYRLFKEVYGIKSSQIKLIDAKESLYKIINISDEDVADIFDNDYDGYILRGGS